MTRARSLPPRRSRSSRTAALLGLVLSGWGCQQTPSYWYFGSGAPACVPVVPAPAAPVHGRAGEPSTEVIEGGTTSLDAPARTTTVIGSETPTRVVVSEPDAPPRVSWRSSTSTPPDAAVATSVQGGVGTSDSSVDR